MKVLSFLVLSFILFIQSGFNSNALSGPPPWVQGSTSKACYPLDELNFGVLVYNKDFKIYRSKGLGKAGIEALQKHLTANGLELPSKIVYMNFYGFGFEMPTSLQTAKKSAIEALRWLYSYTSYRNGPAYDIGNYALEEEELSHSATPIFKFDFIHGGKSDVYVSGDNPLSDRLTPIQFKTPEGKDVYRIGGRMALYLVLDHLLTHDEAVDFHCQGGIHRTGMIALLIRYLQDGYWTTEEDSDEFEHLLPYSYYGFTNYAGIRNLAEFEYLQHNPKDFKQANLIAIRELVKDVRFRCLREKFSCYLNAKSQEPVSCYTQNESQYKDCSMPLDKKQAWNECARLSVETEIAAELDAIEPEVIQKNPVGADKSKFQERLSLTLKKIENITLPAPASLNDTEWVSQIKIRLDARTRSLIELSTVSDAAIDSSNLASPVSNSDGMPPTGK